MNYLENVNDFENLIKEGDVLVDFFATWCGPCKMLSPILEKVSNDLKVDTYKVNVDEVEDLAREYAIMSIPTLLLFEKGELVNKHIGFMVEEELREFLK